VYHILLSLDNTETRPQDISLFLLVLRIYGGFFFFFFAMPHLTTYLHDANELFPGSKNLVLSTTQMSFALWGTALSSGGIPVREDVN
jgi:hypothetical protein